MNQLGDLAAAWPQLNRLLDEALALEAAERDGWLAALPAEHGLLKDTLARLLDVRSGLETGDFLGTLPKLDAGVLGPFASSAEAGTAVGPWRLLREIGAGGMGSVWLAERADGAYQRQVALKLPRVDWAPGLVERMARERDILATLEHPHIARLYDAGLDVQRRPWLALEHVRGLPIDQHARDKGLDVRQRVQLLLQVCEAVAYAHSRLVIHRDLKPSNILVTDDGRVKLLDFGIAKLVQGDKAEATALTAIAGRAMTRDYASPEQVRGEALTTASDIYSLGVVAYELLTGARPYQLRRGSAAELEDAIEQAAVPLASAAAAGPALRKALRGDIDAVLHLALKKTPAERYPTVAALREDLERHLLGQPLWAQPERWRQRLRRQLWRYRWALGVAAAASLTLLGGLYAQLAVMLALTAGVVAALWQRQVALQQRDSARAERQRATQSAEQARAEAERAQRAQERADAVAQFLAELLGEAQADTPITAADLLARAEKLAQVEGASPAQRAAVLMTLADMHASYSNMGKAGELLATAEQQAQSGQDDEQLGLVRIMRASVTARSAAPEAGRAALEQLATQYAAQPVVAHRALFALAYLAQNNNDAVAAVAWAEQAQQMVMLMPRPPPRGQALALANLAYGKSLAGQPDEALALYDAAIRQYQDAHAGESGEALTVLNNWGLAELMAGNPQRALQRFDRAMAVARRRSPDGHLPVYLLANRMRTLLTLHRIDDALQCVAPAREAASRSGIANLELHVRCTHADALRRGGDLTGARALIQDATHDFQGRVSPEGPAVMNLKRLTAQLDLHDGRLHDARTGMDQVIASFIARGLVGGSLAAALGERADILWALGDAEHACTDITLALETARKAQGQLAHSADTGIALRQWGQAEMKQGRAAAAAAAWAEAANHLSSTLGSQHPEVRLVQELQRTS